MFPPTGEEVWNEYLLWQPIPVHTVPQDLDRLFLNSKPCPLFDRLLHDHFSSSKMQEHLAKYKQLFQYLEHHSGMPIRNASDAHALLDTLRHEQSWNKT